MSIQDSILLIVLLFLLLGFGIQYFIKRRKNNREIYQHLRNNKGNYRISDIDVKFKYGYNLFFSSNNCDIYFLTGQIILVKRKSNLLFPASASIYSISNLNSQLSKDLFENKIGNYSLKTADNLLTIEGFFETDRVINQDNEPVDGDFMKIKIPVNLKQDKLRSLLIDCILVNDC